MNITFSKSAVFLYLICAIIFLSFSGCGKKDDPIIQNDSTKTKSNLKVDQFAGNYGDDSYSARSTGADYKVLSVIKTGEHDVQIYIRSRADIKKPSCTFKSIAVPISENVLRAEYEGTGILFTLAGDKITISAEKSESGGILNFFCSGGGSIGGVYTKSNEPLEEKMFNFTDFSKKLTKNGVTFNVSLVSSQIASFLRIQPEGLKDNSPVNHEINGFINDAAAEDLNGDGSPEIIVFTLEGEKNNVTWVIAYTAENKKTLEPITFPRIEDNPVISRGFRQPSDLKVEKGKLVQAFPVYKDVTAKAPEMTGNIREVRYNLEKHANAWIFIVDDVVEYPANSQPK